RPGRPPRGPGVDHSARAAGGRPGYPAAAGADRRDPVPAAGRPAVGGSLGAERVRRGGRRGPRRPVAGPGGGARTGTRPRRRGGRYGEAGTGRRAVTGMRGNASAPAQPARPRLAARAGGWLRESRGGLFVIALVVGAGSGWARWRSGT